MTNRYFQNLINAILKGEKLNSPIEEAQKSVTTLLLSNISWKTGQMLNVDPSNGRILNNSKAMETMWGREYEPGWEPKV